MKRCDCIDFYQTCGALNWRVYPGAPAVFLLHRHCAGMLAWSRPAAAAAAALLAGLLAVTRPQAPTVPLVNLTALALGDAAELAVLRRAARGLGAFRVVGHGVDGASVLNASREFFALPMAVKLATSTAAAGGAFQRGCAPLPHTGPHPLLPACLTPSASCGAVRVPADIPLGGESGLASYFEVKEGFCFGHPGGEAEYPEDRTARPNNLTGPNSWPEEAGDPSGSSGGGWRLTLEGFFASSARLSSRLATDLQRALDQPGATVSRAIVGGALGQPGTIVSRATVSIL